MECPLIELRKVSKFFPGVIALNKADLKLYSGEVHGLMGENGAGKSTLLNKLTNAGVLSEDKLFATLDPTTRVLKLPNTDKVLLTDTVGFIRKLPHNLIEAFKSTLEEAKYADIIIHVVDSVHPDMDRQIAAVYETLDELQVGDKPVITLFNKTDLAGNAETIKDMRAKCSMRVSAKTGEGIDEFLDELGKILRENRIHINRCFKYQDAGRIQLIREFGTLISEEYTQDGIEVEAYVPKEIYDKL